MAFIGNFELIDLAVLVLLWFITSMLANLLWTRFVVLRYVGRALIAWLDGLDSDKEGTEALDRFLDRIMKWMAKSGNVDKLLDHSIKYLTNRPIDTGKKIKTQVIDDDGKETTQEVAEVLTPLELIGKTVSRFATKQAMGALGGRGKRTLDAAEALMASGGDVDGMLPMALQAATKGDYGPIMAYGMAKAKSRKDGVQNSTSGTTSKGGL